MRTHFRAGASHRRPARSVSKNTGRRDYLFCLDARSFGNARRRKGLNGGGQFSYALNMIVTKVLVVQLFFQDNFDQAGDYGSVIARPGLQVQV